VTISPGKAIGATRSPSSAMVITNKKVAAKCTCSSSTPSRAKPKSLSKTTTTSNGSNAKQRSKSNTSIASNAKQKTTTTTSNASIAKRSSPIIGPTMLLLSGPAVVQHPLRLSQTHNQRGLAI
jgi:hypothetical protein